eukprot:TRINITY_DN1341_c0_g3_i1.p1 TRINITY_DN1341_c0_g3~~TRINITY_DN1341_c0_g3_i1.p1  ORF type:complete len:107 (-),score=30.21 TRINITY_DN1341_c0_g3_i1:130-450(-)
MSAEKHDTDIDYVPLMVENAVLRPKLKEYALKQCDEYARAFFACSKPRTISLAWSCKEERKALDDCYRVFTSEEHLNRFRKEWLDERNRKVREQAKAEAQQQNTAN